MLKIRNLNKKYFTVDGEIIALDNVSLQVDCGEYIAIVGKSGSGKNTLLNMIGGFDIPEWRDPAMTKESLMPLVEARIEQLCKGGACLPYVALRIPHVNDCIIEILEKRKDFYQIPENREFS